METLDIIQKLCQTIFIWTVIIAVGRAAWLLRKERKAIEKIKKQIKENYHDNEFNLSSNNATSRNTIHNQRLL